MRTALLADIEMVKAIASFARGLESSRSPSGESSIRRVARTRRRSKQMAPIIQTRSGILFRPLDDEPDPTLLDIGDIAHALSNQGRFTGHTRFFYSVAQHSVLVSEEIEDWGLTLEEQLWGLLHDASEAYLADIPTPLKLHAAFRDVYAEHERRVMRAVCLRFGLTIGEPACVHRADQAALAAEVRDLMPENREYWYRLEAVAPLRGRVRPWLPEVSKYEFLHRFAKLKGRT